MMLIILAIDRGDNINLVLFEGFTIFPWELFVDLFEFILGFICGLWIKG